MPLDGNKEYIKTMIVNFTFQNYKIKIFEYLKKLIEKIFKKGKIL